MSLFGSKKQDEIDKLVSENDDLKNQLHSVLLKHGGYEDLEANLARVKKELSDLQQKDDTLNKNLLNHEAGVAQREKYLNDLNSKILELEDIKENLHSTIKSYDAQISLLEERVKELDEKETHSAEIETKLAAVTEKKNLLDHDVAEKEQTFAYLSTIEREIQSDLEKERADLESIKSQINTLNTELLALNETHLKREELLASLNQQEEEAGKKIALLNEEELKKTSFIKSLDEKILLNEEIKNNLEKTLTDFIAQIGRNENAYLEQSGKREIIQNEILSLRKERDDLDNKLNLAKEQFEIFQAEASKHTAVLGTLADELRKYESMKDNLKKEIESLVSENEKYSMQVEEKKEIISGLEANLKELEELHLRTEKEFGSIVEKAMFDFEDIKKIKDETDSELTAKRNDAGRLDESILEKKTILAEKESALNSLEKEILILTRRLDSLKNEKDELDNNLAAVKEGVSSYSSQLTGLKYETEALQIKKSDIQRDVAFLMTQVSREYAEAEIKLRNINDSISSGNNAFLELNRRISSARETLKEINSAGMAETVETENENPVASVEPDLQNDADAGNSTPDEDSGSFGFDSFSIPPDLNDD